MLLPRPMFHILAPQRNPYPNNPPHMTNISARADIRPVYISSAPCCISTASGLRLLLFNTSCGQSSAIIRRRQTPSSQFLIDTIESVVGGELSGWVLSTARLFIIRSTIPCFTVDNHGDLTHDHTRAVVGVDTRVTYSGEFSFDIFGSILGGAVSGRVIPISRVSLLRLTNSCFTIGNRGESTHGQERAVIGVDTGVKYSGEYFLDIFGSIIGGVFSGRVNSISRVSFLRLTNSCFTVGNRGESTHSHARAVIGVDTGVTYSGEYSLDIFWSYIGGVFSGRVNLILFHECPSSG